MKKKSKNNKKQISINLEDYSLEFFVSKFYKLNDYKSMFSLVIPGYPSHFIVKGVNELVSTILTESDRETKLSIIFSQISTENNEKNLIQSVFFEIKIRKIMLNREKNLLLAKIDCDLFSNPYSLFLFDDFMETTFKKSQNIKKNPILMGKQSKNFGFQYVFYIIFKIILKTIDIIRLRPKYACFYVHLIFTVLLKFNGISFGPTKRLKTFFLGFSYGMLSALCYRIVLFNCLFFFTELLRKNILSSKFFRKLIFRSRKYISLLTPSDPDIFEKEFSLDASYFLDIFNIRTLLIGIVRSGNMCSL